MLFVIGYLHFRLGVSQKIFNHDSIYPASVNYTLIAAQHIISECLHLQHDFLRAISTALFTSLNFY